MAESALERILKAVMIPGGKGAGEKIRDAQLQAIDPNVDPKDIKAPLDEQSGLARFTKRFIGMPSNRDINQSFMTQLADIRAPFESEKLRQSGAQELAALKALIDQDEAATAFNRNLQRDEFQNRLALALQKGILPNQLDPSILQSVYESDVAAQKSKNETQRMIDQLTQSQTAADLLTLPDKTKLEQSRLANLLNRANVLRESFQTPISDLREKAVAGLFTTDSGGLPVGLLGQQEDPIMDALKLKLLGLDAEKKQLDIEKASKPEETPSDKVENIIGLLNQLGGGKQEVKQPEAQTLTEEEGAMVLEFIRQLRANKAAGGNG